MEPLEEGRPQKALRSHSPDTFQETVSLPHWQLVVRGLVEDSQTTRVLSQWQWQTPMGLSLPNKQDWQQNALIFKLQTRLWFNSIKLATKFSNWKTLETLPIGSCFSWQMSKPGLKLRHLGGCRFYHMASLLGIWTFSSPPPLLLFLITAIFLRFFDCTDDIFYLLTAIQWDGPRNSCLCLLEEVLDLQTDTLRLQNRLDFSLCETLYVPFSLLNLFPCLWDEDSHVGFRVSLRDTWKFMSLVSLALAM